MRLKQHPQDLILFFPIPPPTCYNWNDDSYGLPIYRQSSRIFNVKYDNLSIVNHMDIYKQLSEITSPLERMDVLTKHVEGQRHELKEGDKLFFHHSCTFPRSLITGKFKESKHNDDYDAVVIPIPEQIAYNTFVTIFRSTSIADNHNPIIIFEDPVPANMGESGKTLASILLKNYRWVSESDLELLKNSKCIHRGAIIGYSDYNTFVPNVIDNKYKSVVTEHDIIRFLAGKDDEFTVDSVSQLASMAISSDIESKELCLRTLAAMDYTSYPFVTSKIVSYALEDLGEESIGIDLCSKAVKYMINELKHINPLRGRYLQPKEVCLIKELAKAKILVL